MKSSRLSTDRLCDFATDRTRPLRDQDLPKDWQKPGMSNAAFDNWRAKFGDSQNPTRNTQQAGGRTDPAAGHRPLGQTPDVWPLAFSAAVPLTTDCRWRRPLNHKRVYWIMLQNNLLQTRLTNSQPCEAHTGKVFTLQWNQHWGPWRAWDCLRQEREGRVIFARRLGEAVGAFSATTCGYRVNRT